MFVNIKIKLIAFFLLFGILFFFNLTADTEKQMVRILFIGNSFTNECKETLLEMLKASPYESSVFEFITTNGRELMTHLNDKPTVETIKSGFWDYVVLQGHSQVPGLPGEQHEKFQHSVDAFGQIIKNAGAKTILFMTWGWRDGNPVSKEIFPDFTRMQNVISNAYLDAAKRNNMMLAPVGLAWADIRKKDNTLWKKLYKEDGSHPTIYGAYLASAILYKAIFQELNQPIPFQEELNPEEQGHINQVILDTKILNR